MESIVSPKYHHWQVALEWASEPGTLGHVRKREGRASALAGLLFWWGDQPSEVRGSLGDGSPVSWGMCAPENERAVLMVQAPSPPSLPRGAPFSSHRCCSDHSLVPVSEVGPAWAAASTGRTLIFQKQAAMSDPGWC